MASISRREHRSSVIWPGFVDALATLLMVIIFLLMIFVLAQFFLGQALSGRDKALRALENDLSALSKVLALTKTENEQLQLGVNSLLRDSTLVGGFINFERIIVLQVFELLIGII